jgi:biotin transport system substrate-specific component
VSSRPVIARSSQSVRRAALVPSLAAVLVGSLLLAVSAHVAVPFWPVPITLQTLAVLLIGAALGPRLAAATVVAYIGEGLLGLPVFSQGGGVAALVGPTGGYIAGFLPAAVLVGLAARRGWLTVVWRAAAIFVLADAVVFAFGLSWLSLAIGPSKAIAAGLTPFLLGEVIKIGLAMALVQLWQGLRARG